MNGLPSDHQALCSEPDPTNAARLDALRQRVRHSGFPVADYGSPDELGERVLADFEHLIDCIRPSRPRTPPSGQQPFTPRSDGPGSACPCTAQHSKPL